MLVLAWWQRAAPAADRRRATLLTLAFLAIAQALLAFLLAGSTAWVQLLLVTAVGAGAAFAADALVRWRPRARLLPALAGLLLVVGWFGAGHALLAVLYRPGVAPAEAPSATMLTGLPLRWAAGGGIAAMIAAGAQDDPVLARLEAAGPVSLVDSLVDHVPPPGGTLLVAHPRALAPRELVAIDAFVRGGGRAVVLADALSGWPARYPLGDPRNPPVTSLLTPLLDHWGVALGAVPAEEDRLLPVDVDGSRLNLFSAGRFDRLPRACLAFADRRAARCPIGSGEGVAGRRRRPALCTVVAACCPGHGASPSGRYDGVAVRPPVARGRSWPASPGLDPRQRHLSRRLPPRFAPNTDRFWRRFAPRGRFSGNYSGVLR